MIHESAVSYYIVRDSHLQISRWGKESCMFSFFSPDNLPLLVHFYRRYRPVVLTNIAHNSFIFFVSAMLKKSVKGGGGEKGNWRWNFHEEEGGKELPPPRYTRRIGRWMSTRGTKEILCVWGENGSRDALYIRWVLPRCAKLVKKYFFCFSVCSAYLSKLITTRVKELTKTEMPCEVGKGTNCTFWKQAKLSYLSYSPGGRRRGSRVRRRRARILK